MSIKTSMSKCFFLLIVSLGQIACSYMLETPRVLADQREAYKKVHELPSLEMPPELEERNVKNEYDGSAKGTTTVPSKNTMVEATPLDSDSGPVAELVNLGNGPFLLVHDSFRNTWRKTISKLEELGYDIEDKNRLNRIIYINIAEDNGSNSMLSSLSFWSRPDTTVYIVALKIAEDSVEIRVSDEDKRHIDDLVSKGLLADLLGQLAL